MEFTKKLDTGLTQRGLTTAAIALGCVGTSYLIWRHMFRLREASEALNYLTVNIITNENSCDNIITALKRSCSQYKAVGFDCEWVTEHGKRHPIALLQLSTYDGLCGLFRLSHMKSVPTSLKELIEDETIYKVGVAPKDDARLLFDDYGVVMKSTLDIRHLAQICGHKTGGLAALSKSLLGVLLDKNWRVRCSDWDAEELTQRQINYAAADAHVAIKIFVNLVNSYHSKGLLSWIIRNRRFEENWHEIKDEVQKFINLGFKPRIFCDQKQNGNKQSKNKGNRYPHATRSKPLYHNCFLAAPDGELLCTCDNKKAQWYIDKGLADVISENPYTVQLRFEPTSRMVGDAGKYYQLTKENKCVVCGKSNTYIRKNVVPREYRKYFPEVMKEHSSHDVVLLCVECHRNSNIADQNVRMELAAKCGAKLSAYSDNGRYMENTDLKKLRSAARALSLQAKRHVLPETRRRELKELILQHYPGAEHITDELINDAASCQVMFENPEYESHGLKVVENYLEKEGGLLKLEQLWREHFLNVMKPRYLPSLWSVTHNEERLRIRWKEGRLSRDEMKQIGVNW